MKQALKNLLRRTVPLAVRKRLCVFLNGRRWISPCYRFWWTQELLRDFADRDQSNYHRFLWAHHLGYALNYEVEKCFGAENMKASRKLFFAELREHLERLGLPPSRVQAVFEAGCSLGYQLRYLETDLFPGATDLGGIDIDQRAIVQGTEHLRRLGSRVQLRCADMGDLGTVLAGKTYDVLVCTGVLMYLAQAEAAAVVRTMLQHCRGVLALSGPAHPDQDNGTLEQSPPRANDGSFLHNLDEMVRAAGGAVIGRRWEGARQVEGHTLYFVFAVPPSSTALENPLAALLPDPRQSRAQNEKASERSPGGTS